MNNLLPQLFVNEKFGQIRTIQESGKVYFVASDIAKALGYSNTSKAINDHCKGVTKRYIPTNGGNQEMNVIPEGDIYRLAAKSELPSAEQFESWIFDEVLPTIRKHGAYLTPEKLEEALLNPDTIIRLATTLKEEREKNKALQILNMQKDQVINELKPKATYYDLVLQNKSLLSTTKIAKDFGLSAITLNKILAEEKIQFKQGDCWLLYQAFADKGYTQSKTHIIDGERSKFHTYWTQKGRLFIYELLRNKRSILPLIEREVA